MITVLLSTIHKAIKKVYSPLSKLPKNFRIMPVLSHVLIEGSEGRVKVTQAVYNPKAEALQAVSESIPARIDSEFAVCVPAKVLNDWIRVSQLTKEEKASGTSEQITLSLDPATQILKIICGPTRAQFKGIDAQEFPTLQPMEG